MTIDRKTWFQCRIFDTSAPPAQRLERQRIRCHHAVDSVPTTECSNAAAVETISPAIPIPFQRCQADEPARQAGVVLHADIDVGQGQWRVCGANVSAGRTTGGLQGEC